MVCISQRLKIPEFRRVTPISSPSSLPASALNQGPFPLPALPGLVGTTSLSATPERLSLLSRALRWSSLTTPRGFPCCARCPCVHAVATTPAQRLGHCFAHPPSRVSLPQYGCQVGLRIVLFEACSAFTRVTACTLALPPYFVTRFTRRLQPFRYLHSCSGCFRLERVAGWAFHPLESAALSRRTPGADIRRTATRSPGQPE